MSLLELISLVFLPVLITPVHAVACRLPILNNMSRQKLAVLCAVFCAAYATMVITIASPTPFSAFIFSGTLSLLFAHVYFHIFNMSETARRIKILIEIKTSKKADAPRYSPQGAVSVRMKRLLELNQVEVKNGHYFARPSAFLWVAIAMKRYEYLLFPYRFSRQEEILRAPKSAS